MKSYYKIEANNTEVASADILLPTGDGNVALITRIYVCPGFRDRGFGNTLLKTIIADADLSAVHLKLAAAAEDDDDQKRLEKWYMGQDFKATGNGNFIRYCKPNTAVIDSTVRKYSSAARGYSSTT